MTRREEALKARQQYKDFTLTQIGAKLSPPISGERVRQLLVKRKTCAVHKIKYEKVCRYCKVENEFSKILKSPQQRTRALKELSKPGRDGISTLKRKMLIRFYKDELKKNDAYLAKALQRDRTTIIHLYRSH